MQKTKAEYLTDFLWLVYIANWNVLYCLAWFLLIYVLRRIASCPLSLTPAKKSVAGDIMAENFQISYGNGEKEKRKSPISWHCLFKQMLENRGK